MEDPKQQAKELACQGVDSTHPDAREGFIRLFSLLDLHKYGLSNATQNPERDEHNRRVIEQLISSGPFRRFSFPEDTLEKLEQLKPKVGNFAHVVDHVMDAISLSLRYHKPIKITPILIVGESGIGELLRPSACWVPWCSIAKSRYGQPPDWSEPRRIGIDVFKF